MNDKLNNYLNGVFAPYDGVKVYWDFARSVLFCNEGVQKGNMN
ncbi:hypothetical protein Q0V21_01105 [Paenibacillus sp. 11B]|nr:hypothetical protein [Paenibacillus sp. 11B]MDN8587354.1 hypothetical protein [Paenibacillus sp. 11B]